MSRVTYQEAETYISELPKFTKKNTLEHTQKFLSFLGNPQNGKKVIHVAGTNGKGSVCVYLDAMLRAQRKHTGLFTSPHLIRMNESGWMENRFQTRHLPVCFYGHNRA